MNQSHRKGLGRKRIQGGGKSEGGGKIPPSWWYLTICSSGVLCIVVQLYDLEGTAPCNLPLPSFPGNRNTHTERETLLFWRKQHRWRKFPGKEGGGGDAIASRYFGTCLEGEGGSRGSLNLWPIFLVGVSVSVIGLKT